MRQVTIICKTRKTAKRRTPWASVWIKVIGGGWEAFESWDDARVWRNQK